MKYILSKIVLFHKETSSLPIGYLEIFEDVIKTTLQLILKFSHEYRARKNSAT